MKVCGFFPKVLFVSITLGTFIPSSIISERQAAPNSRVKFPWGDCGAAMAHEIQSGHDLPKAKIRETYGNLPLWFEANRGQTDASVKFLFRNGACTLFLTSTEAVLVFPREQRSEAAAQNHKSMPPSAEPEIQRTDSGNPYAKAAQQISTVLRMKLVDANLEPQILGLEELQGKVNYFMGNDPKKWRAHIPTYAKVKYENAYPGIDVVYTGTHGQLEYDFIVAPGADPKAIQLNFEGADRVEVAADGDLILHTAAGLIRQHRPLIFQDVDGARRQIEGGYVLNDKHQIGFRVGKYDPARPLVIDPVLVYSTYLGGSSFDEGFAIAIDGSGNAYVTGSTQSTNFPTANPLQAKFGGGAYIFIGDVFLAKVNAAGSALMYATYLGGSSADAGYGIAVDKAGNAYVTGETASSDFPTKNPLQGTYAGGWDAFVAKVSPDGSGLVYSTFLGGSSGDAGNGIAVDGTGNAYVTGGTSGFGFPTTKDALQPNSGGNSDAFVAKLNPTGSALVYSTYLGGSSDETGRGIAVDGAGSAYVTGETFSSNFPTKIPLQSALGKNPFTSDAFVAKISPEGSALVYSTYLGGSDPDVGHGIAVDGAGNACVTGKTNSFDFPTRNPLQPLFGGNPFITDAFLAKINADGSALVYSTYLGGSLTDVGRGIAVDGDGNAYVTGGTDSPDFPTKYPLQPYFGGQNDAFVVKVNPTGSALVYSTNLGGKYDDVGRGIAVDASGNAFVTGGTASTDFPVNAAAFQKSISGFSDAFVAKVGYEGAKFSGSPIIPNSGGDTGAVSVFIYGSGFAQGAAVKLAMAGQPDIVGSPVTVAADGQTLETTFDLKGKAQGLWDVVVKSPDGTTSTLSQSFNIEKGVGAKVWVDIVGLPLILVGREATFSFLYGNRGNVNGTGVPLWIGGIPSNAAWRLGFNITPPPVLPGDEATDWSQVPIHFVSDGQIFIPLFIPAIPPGARGVLKMGVTIPSEGEIRLQTWTNPPFFRSDPADCVIECVIAATRLAFEEDVEIPDTCVRLTQVERLKEAIKQQGVQSFKQMNYKDIEAISKCLVAEGIKKKFQPLEIVDRFLKTTKNIKEAVKIREKCGNCKPKPPPSPPEPERDPAFAQEPEPPRDYDTKGVRSIDPNDKVGSQGAATGKYISGEEPLRYVIFFENLAAASAPAQEVVITDPLDVTSLDLSTMSLGPIAFGDKEIVPRPGLSEFTNDVDLRPGKNIVLRIEARLDSGTGLLTWHFTSLDPATGQLPEDPLQGFLPPNVTPPQGQGSVIFTVMPKKGLRTGTEIRNQASIVFDVNPALKTPEWLNTIDNTKPSSQILPLAATKTSPNFSVEWSGSDEGSGVLNYKIFVSKDGGPFALWLSNTTATSGVFPGEVGRTYAFYSVVSDQTGNLEETPLVADATTKVINDSGGGAVSGGGGGGGGGGCFIATVAYGSHLHPHVKVLRDFKNNYLMTNGPGRILVSYYSKVSPPMANYIRGSEPLRTITRFVLTPIVYGIEYPLLILILGGAVIGMRVYGRKRKGSSTRRGGG